MKARACILLAAVALGCAAEDRPPDLALVVLDTVGPSHLSVYGYERPTTPFLERFADSARRFDRAYSSSSWTLPAHVSAFTGVSAARHGADQVSQRFATDFETLAERLAAAGYQTAGFSNNPWLSHSRGTARGFEEFRELFRDKGGVPRSADRHPTVTAVASWLRDERDPGRPFFVFVNLTDAHFPYTPPWRYAEPFFAGRPAWRAALERMAALQPLNVIRRHYLGGAATGLLAAGDIDTARDLYDAEIRYLDAISEHLVAAIDAAASGDTLVAIASDHGENFGDHDHMGHAFSLYDSTLRIALLLRGSAFEPGSRSSALVGISDLFPTFIAATGRPASAEAKLDGRDLGGVPDPERSIEALYAHPVQALHDFAPPQRAALSAYDRELRAAIIGTNKLIRGSDGSEEIYDLAADPGEEHPLTGLDAKLLERLRAAAGSPRRRPDPGGEPLAHVDPATRRALEAMGYVQPAPSAGGESPSDANPDQQHDQ